MAKTKPLPNTFRGEDWMSADEALTSVRAVIGRRSSAIASLRQGLKSNDIRACAKATLLELDLGLVQPLSTRNTRFELEFRKPRKGTVHHLGMGFWINRYGQSHLSYSWRKNRFVQHYPPAEHLIRPDGHVEFLAKPGRRYIAYGVQLLKADVRRLIHRLRARNISTDLGEPNKTGSKPRYNWSLLHSLEERARRGELDLVDSVINRGGRRLQAPVEELIQHMVGCSEAQARRKARPLMKLHNDAAKPSTQ